MLHILAQKKRRQVPTASAMVQNLHPGHGSGLKCCLENRSYFFLPAVPVDFLEEVVFKRGTPKGGGSFPKGGR